jgi:twitching motility protein PilT
VNFPQLLKFGVDQGASDIHLQTGSSPQLRLGGAIRNVESPPLQAEPLRQFAISIAPKGIADDLEGAIARGLLFSATVEGVGRFRVKLYSQLGEPGLVLRWLPSVIRSLDELHMPAVIRDIALSRRGLVLIAGRSGSGRTTTLAAMVDLINGSRPVKIVTIERPVELLYPRKTALLTHLEVGRDVPSFEDGVGQALEQDPDVLVVGDIPNLATLRIVLQAADAGRLVFAALTGPDAAQTLERGLAMFSGEDRRTATSMLVSSLEAIIGLRLANAKDGSRLPVVEVLRADPLTKMCVRENRLGELGNYIAGRQVGMQTFDQHLIELQQAGLISGTEALRLATNTEAVATELRGLRPSAGG